MFPGAQPPDLKTVDQFPRRVREHPHVEIPLSDGVRLAARIWLPEDAAQHPVPVVLEAIPYRKRDATLADDERSHPYVAGHGYACVRLAALCRCVWLSRRFRPPCLRLSVCFVGT